MGIEIRTRIGKAIAKIFEIAISEFRSPKRTGTTRTSRDTPTGTSDSS